MFCPVCHAEYREGFFRCNDCDVDLVHALPVEEQPSAGEVHFVRLWQGADPVLYSALIAALRETDVPFFDNPPRDYDNWLSAREQTGINVGLANFDVRVPENRFAEAAEILNDLLAQRDRPPEAGPEEE